MEILEDTDLFVNIGRWTSTEKEKRSITTPKLVSMAKEGEKDVKVGEDAAKAKFMTTLPTKTYPSYADKLYKHGLRK